MKVKTSFLTASILKECCEIDGDLLEQIDKIPPKAETVYLYVTQEEMTTAHDNLKNYMLCHDGWHTESFERTLRELEWLSRSR